MRFCRNLSNPTVFGVYSGFGKCLIEPGPGSSGKILKKFFSPNSHDSEHINIVLYALVYVQEGKNWLILGKAAG